MHCHLDKAKPVVFDCALLGGKGDISVSIIYYTNYKLENSSKQRNMDHFPSHSVIYSILIIIIQYNYQTSL